ncbi:DMT family transporter [Spirochaeta isovalerica]|uniref:Drug/metabolite transporter (DMT)-like permease n=1 Tax=Spirochaeta isovalerica TaxID=150 RepID=A0A841R777_9SPIO|nr:DMT family transporter [Spirochaeta isovalerica]MBB6479686.1 drug/metabolite transporter (DMT)-like permease [Spirochaeta isovalerica]
MDEIREPLKQEVKSILLPITAIMGAVILWGSSFAGTRVALRSLEPGQLVWIRQIFAVLAILPFAGKLYPRHYRKGDWKLLIPMVLFQPCLYFFFESNALVYTTSSQAGVVAAVVPVLVALGAWMFLKETIGIKTIMGMVLSIGGVVVLTLSQSSGSQASNPVLGNSLEFMAMIFGAANMVIVKKMSGRYSPFTLTAMQMVTGFIFFSPAAFSLFRTSREIWTPELIILLVYMGVFVSLGAFALYNWGMSHLPASKASVFINLVPVTAILFGWILIGEGLNPVQTGAAIVVILGVLLSQSRRIKRNWRL